MTKRTFAVFAVFLLLFLVGCQKEESTSLSGKAFLGGTQGLEVTFLPGQPPAEVFDKDSPFQIGLKIENKGEFDIEKASDITVTIEGINPANFEVSKEDLTKESSDALEGASIDGSGNKVSGDYTTVDFPEMNYASTVQGSVQFPIRANVCYEYGTKSQGQLCTTKDLRGVTGEATVCNPERTISMENSGAPIQITNIRQNVAGANKVDFFFTITKSGAATDSLYKTGTKCSTVLSDKDVVYIEVSDTGLGEITCSGLSGKTTGFVTLFEGSREIRCSQKVDNPIDAETPIEINLKYAYKQFIDKELVVKHAS